MATAPQPRVPPLNMLARVHALWDELSDFGAAQVNDALEHALRKLAGMVEAQNAFWMGVVRLDSDEADPLDGWRPRAIRYLHPRLMDTAYAEREMRGLNRAGPAPHEIEYLATHLRGAGTFRASRISTMMDARWFEGEDYRSGYLVRGITDVLHVFVPVGARTESCFGFHRRKHRPHFSAEEESVVEYALRGLKWFHSRVLLGQGLLVARERLLPAERRVQSLLLTDRSEKEIARELGLSATTTHKYATEVFRKFGVRGRAGLTALWLGWESETPRGSRRSD